MGGMVRRVMAKDRTRHARRREPERVGVSLIELVRLAIDNLRYEFADAAKCAEELRRASDGI